MGVGLRQVCSCTITRLLWRSPLGARCYTHTHTHTHTLSLSLSLCVCVSVCVCVCVFLCARQSSACALTSNALLIKERTPGELRLAQHYSYVHCRQLCRISIRRCLCSAAFLLFCVLLVASLSLPRLRLVYASPPTLSHRVRLQQQ